MTQSLFERVQRRGQEAVLGSGVLVREVIERLEAGESLAQASEALHVGSADLVAALGSDALGPGPADGPPLVQARPKRPRLAKALSEESIALVLPGAAHPVRLALAAGLYQIFDFWDPSHVAAQQADDLGERLTSAYWHGIAHRREPDAGNATYWFRRVGRHAAFQTLASASRALLEPFPDAALARRLSGSLGAWDPYAMIDLCTTARPGTPQHTLARSLQRLEMQILLDLTAAAAGVQ